MADNLELKTTERGFSLVEFEDMYKTKCSLQESSNASTNAIWLGANEIGLKEFIAYAETPWRDRKEFDVFNQKHHYIANNRMLLSQEQVQKLLPMLQKFAETGTLS